MTEKVTEYHQGDSFHAARRRQLSAVIDRQAQFLYKFRIPGTDDKFKGVCIGKIKGEDGKPYSIYADGVALSRGFRRVIESIRADLSGK